MNSRPRRAAAKRQNYATAQVSSQEPSENEASEEVIKPKKRQRRSKSDDTDTSSRKKSTEPEFEELGISDVLGELENRSDLEAENNEAGSKFGSLTNSIESLILFDKAFL